MLGGAGCLLLVATLPWQGVIAGLAVYAVGVAYRAIRLGGDADHLTPRYPRTLLVLFSMD